MNRPTTATADGIRNVRRIVWDLQTLTPEIAGLAVDQNEVIYESLSGPYDVSITTRTGNTLTISSTQIVATRADTDGPVSWVTVAQRLVPIAEADATLDELVATRGVDGADAEAWKSNRSSTGPSRTFPTNDPDLAVEFYNVDDQQQTISYVFYVPNGFGPH